VGHAFTPREVEQGKLRPDVETIRRYGQAHPEDFVEVWFEGTRLVAFFAGNANAVASHEAALRAAVAYPDQLEVRRSPRTAREVEEIRAEIMSAYEGRWHGMGNGKGVVHVRLWADQVEAAAEIHRRYGDAVEIDLGSLPYPDPFALRSGRLVSPAEAPLPPSLPDGVRLSLPDDFTVRSGANAHTVLSVRNDTAEEVKAMSNGTLFPPVVEPGTGTAVGGYAGAMTLQLVIHSVAPGAGEDIPVVVGTASFRPEVGWAVPPGRWALAFALQAGGVHGRRLLPLEVTA
jgi:hypothetical protein